MCSREDSRVFHLSPPTCERPVTRIDGQRLTWHGKPPQSEANPPGVAAEGYKRMRARSEAIRIAGSRSGGGGLPSRWGAMVVAVGSALARIGATSVTER